MILAQEMRREGKMTLRRMFESSHAGSILLSGLALACLLTGTAVSAEMPPKEVRVIFRFDDPSAASSTDIESKLIELFRHNNMVCTWAIIPFSASKDLHDPDRKIFRPLPTEKAERFAEAAHAGVLEIALHGYTHDNNELTTGSAEFAMLPYGEQLERIEKGKRSLEAALGVEVTIFVPPWNQYDANTLKALEAHRFRYLSAGLGGAYDSSQILHFLPCSPVRLPGIKQAIAAARKTSDPTPIVVVLFHEFDFFEFDDPRGRGDLSLDQFSDILSWLAKQEDVRIVPMSSVMDAGVDRYAGNLRLTGLSSMLPPWLRKDRRMPFYASEAFASRQGDILRPSLFGFYTVYFLLVGSVCFLAARTVSLKMPMFLRRHYLAVGVLLLFGPLLLLLNVVWPFYGLGSGSKGLLSVIGGVGYYVGTCSVALSHRKVTGAFPPSKRQ